MISTRAQDIGQLKQQIFDVLIIGGGINGAAVANISSLNRLNVALIDKGDFASGTSSRSTKLIHGGLRYLENFEFDLVREALRERSILLASAPHLIRPLGFIIPVYLGDRRPLWMMRLGVSIYDFLSGSAKIQKHRSLTVEEVVKEAPGIKQDGLVGGVLYFDAQMDDARLCLENVLQARSQGAVVANYLEAREFVKVGGRVEGVKLFDLMTGEHLEIKARKIVCAVGPWTNTVIDQQKLHLHERVRTTKGVHLVYKEELITSAMLIPARSDKRVFFAIPWMGHTLIGTTDTDYQGFADNVMAEEADIEYLLNEFKRVFPSRNIERSKIVTVFAGLRPLVHKAGHPSAVSRKHQIETTKDGVVFVMGGKYTTFRPIAEDCVRQLTKNELINTSKAFPLYGGGQCPETSEKIGQRFGIKKQIIEYLQSMYGTRCVDVLELSKKDPSLAEPLCTCSPAIKAQVVYALLIELAVKEDDIIARRLGLIYRDCPSQNCRREISRIMASQL